MLKLDKQISDTIYWPRSKQGIAPGGGGYHNGGGGCSAYALLDADFHHWMATWLCV